MTKTETAEPTDIIDVEPEEETTGAHLPAVADEPLEGIHGTLATIRNDPWADVASGEVGKPDVGGIPWIASNFKNEDGAGWVDPITGEVGVQELDFVWMAKSTSRVLFDGPYDPLKETKIRCRSFDGIVPDPSLPMKQTPPEVESTEPERQSPTCADCQYARWVDGKQECHESIEALVMLRDGNAGQLARMRFGGLAFKPARDYWRSFTLRLPKRPAIAFLSKAKLSPVKVPNGTFLVPTLTREIALSRTEAQPIIEERDRRIAEWKTLVAEDVETIRADVDDGGGRGRDAGDPFADNGPASPPASPGGAVDASAAEAPVQDSLDADDF